VTVLYCTPADIRENVGGTDNGTGTCAQLTDDQLTEAIGRASSKVSAYAGTTFEADASTPVVVVPDLIFGVTVAIASFYGTLTYRKNKPLAQYDPVMLGYTDAMATLNAIASGAIQVSAPDPGEPPSSGAARVINTVPRTFTGADSGTERTLWGGIEARGAPGTGWGYPGGW
jgi:phage gp36-like protein